MSIDKFTPLMKQYHQIKEQHKEHLLFFRLGDFYEMFGDDARKAAPILEVALTKRNDVPMCGVPYHSVTNYLAKLIRAGLRVAVCEQMEDPSTAKGIVKREVVRVITPGTILEENLLESKNNNYLCGLFPDNKSQTNNSYGIAFVDVSTGEFQGTEILSATPDKIISELTRFSVREILIPKNEEKKTSLISICKQLEVSVHYYDWLITPELGAEYLTQKLGMTSLKGWGLENKNLFLGACAAVLNYLEETQGKLPEYLQQLKYYSSEKRLVLDDTVVRSLELLVNRNTGLKSGSLFNVLDRTLTAMGGRLLRYWILNPLLDINQIQVRQKIAQTLVEDTILRQNLQQELKSVLDLERLIGRIVSGHTNARDLVNLKSSLIQIPRIKEKTVSDTQNEIVSSVTELEKLASSLEPLPEMVELLEKSIVDAPPIDLHSGGIIKTGYSAQLDELHLASRQGKEWIAALEKKERERSGINSLKVGYTSVFGYYIEVSKANLHLVPSDYVRKQTLVNCERFITPELKEKESLILGAEEKMCQLEYQIFQEIRQKIVKETQGIQHNAQILAQIDVFVSLAQVACENCYVCPKIDESNLIEIKDGRHPVVEKMVMKGFVPNDTFLNAEEQQIVILTGPNMAGKSTYIRQVALIVIMSQMGSFVPAKQSRIGLVDQIFTRIGTGENIASGESTFMVEMMETANILHNCTNRSLLILDEIGRGTSTFDGVSIAWATAEYLAKQRKDFAPKVLFATHYFELTELAENLANIKNYNVAVREWGDEIVFLHKIVEGSADRSYGIHVAKLAGMPNTVINRAREILKELESKNYQQDKQINIEKEILSKQAIESQLDLFSNNHRELITEIKEIDVNNITPIESLKKIQEWKNKLEQL